MSDFFFTQTHECYRLEGESAVVSISEYAVDQLGEITYVQLPAVGTLLKQGDSFGEVESVKTVSELYAPVSGTVEAVNEALDGTPELVNDEPLGKGWLIRIKTSEAAADSMDRAAYTSYLEGLS
ncbi:MAG: glycine cleavage system protein H [Candidatus Melainabacteria bacterium HGW-Melainabacteria-1]|nr:MAG: glycine cleavage system protein H [Candidatus Melainabacteria bacterium HGW-Melainabacteria-1]